MRRSSGELLKQFDARGDHWENKRDGSGPSISQRALANQAGMSDRQRITAPLLQSADFAESLTFV